MPPLGGVLVPVGVGDAVGLGLVVAVVHVTLPVSVQLPALAPGALFAGGVELSAT
jgi:hypothetical protein